MLQALSYTRRRGNTSSPGGSDPGAAPVELVQHLQRTARQADALPGLDPALAQIDADERGPEQGRKPSDGRNRRAGPELHHDGPGHTMQPRLEALLLAPGAFGIPLRIIEHQYIGARQPATGNTARQGRAQAAGACIHARGPGVCLPEPARAIFHTLQPVQGPMALDNLFFRKPGFLELTVDIAGVDERTVLHLVRPATEDSETVVRLGVPV